MSSEISLQLPPSESESFTVSRILSFPINIFCEEFSELTLSPVFHVACGEQNITNWSDVIDT
jgi:hypothetical protein